MVPASRYDLVRMITAISTADPHALQLLRDDPSLAVARLARADEFFAQARLAQLYEGDTALHAAAFAQNTTVARELVAAGSVVDASNRRGAQPIHAAVMGGPITTGWDPVRQVEMIRYLIEVGAKVDAVAVGGVTPLHRAVRNRCSAAVGALLAAGADPDRRNNSGSNSLTLAQMTTGRGGTGTDAAKAEQQVILRLLAQT